MGRIVQNHLHLDRSEMYLKFVQPDFNVTSTVSYVEDESFPFLPQQKVPTLAAVLYYTWSWSGILGAWSRTSEDCRGKGGRFGLARGPDIRLRNTS